MGPPGRPLRPHQASQQKRGTGSPALSSAQKGDARCVGGRGRGGWRRTGPHLHHDSSQREQRGGPERRRVTGDPRAERVPFPQGARREVTPRTGIPPPAGPRHPGTPAGPPPQARAFGPSAHRRRAPGLGRQPRTPPLHRSLRVFARSGVSRQTPAGHFLALLPYQASRWEAAVRLLGEDEWKRQASALPHPRGWEKAGPSGAAAWPVSAGEKEPAGSSAYSQAPPTLSHTSVSKEAHRAFILQRQCPHPHPRGEVAVSSCLEETLPRPEICSLGLGGLSPPQGSGLTGTSMRALAGCCFGGTSFLPLGPYLPTWLPTAAETRSFCVAFHF